MKLGKIILLCGLSLASACGARPRPVPNDEVSTPMNADDEASLDKRSHVQADAGPLGDASPNEQ